VIIHKGGNDKSLTGTWIHKKNKLHLLYLENFVKDKTGESILNSFGIDVKNQFFLPTELGNFAGKN